MFNSSAKKKIPGFQKMKKKGSFEKPKKARNRIFAKILKTRKK